MGEIQKTAAGLRRNIEARIRNCSVTIALAERPLKGQTIK